MSRRGTANSSVGGAAAHKIETAAAIEMGVTAAAAVGLGKVVGARTEMTAIDTEVTTATATCRRGNHHRCQYAAAQFLWTVPLDQVFSNAEESTAGCCWFLCLSRLTMVTTC